MGSALEQWASGVRDWIGTGKTYRIAPSRGYAGLAIVLLAVIALMFGGASVLGLTVNPSPGGFLFLAVTVLGPAGGIALLLVFLRRAGLNVDATFVFRTNVFGSVVARCGRAQVVGVAVNKGSYAGWFVPGAEPEENVMWLKVRGGGTAMPTNMYFYTVEQARGLAAVLGVPFDLV